MPQLKMTIVWDSDTDACDVRGPVDQRTLAYGILKRAEKEIDLYHAKKANGSPIVTAGAAMLGEGRN